MLFVSKRKKEHLSDFDPLKSSDLRERLSWTEGEKETELPNLRKKLQPSNKDLGLGRTRNHWKQLDLNPIWRPAHANGMHNSQNVSPILFYNFLKKS